MVLAFGVAGAPDYGLAHDQRVQRSVGEFTVEYVLGESRSLLRHNLRYYGAWFEVALRAAARGLGLADVQHVFLSRYILSHAFFLLGAFACYLLAWRLFQSRLLALLAMLFLLCHPRLFGHSFFNSKDTPFLAMFLLALLFAQRALRSGSIAAHAGLGVWIGLIASVRPFAFLLVALVPLARVMDFVRGSRRERTRLLLAAGALLAASVPAFFIALPYLWGDPLGRFAEWFGLMSSHTHVMKSLFLGELISTDDRPWAYVPVWFAVTTPPTVTALALLGLVALAARLPRGLRGRGPGASPGFELLLVLAVLVPVVVVTLLVGNIYNGWRHMYFAYGPVCLLAGAGLAWLRRAAGRRLGSLALAVAAAGLVAPVAWIALLHPHEHVYFNFLVDRKTPERLRTRFDMDYWAVSHKEVLEFLLALHPERTVPVAGTIAESIKVLPAKARSRVVRSAEFSAYFASDYRFWWGEGKEEGPTYARPVRVRKVFGNTLYAIVRLQVDDSANTRYAPDYATALASPSFAEHAPFGVRWDGEALTYLGDDCRPADVDGRFYDSCKTIGGAYCSKREAPGRFFLHVIGDSKSGAATARYVHNEDFQFRHRGVVLRAGPRRICMARVELEDYVVDALRTGQLNGKGAPAWSATITTANPAALAQALARVASGEPRVRGRYDIHLDMDAREGALLYVKEGCREEDRAAPFFLHVVPLHPRAVPPAVAERGFANRDFTFATHGAALGDTCVLRARLPAFAARTARTGQYVGGQGEIWSVDVALGNSGDQ